MPLAPLNIEEQTSSYSTQALDGRWCFPLSQFTIRFVAHLFFKALPKR